jgi:inositol phosphorylceramide synthase catalytic subunit
MKIISTDKSMRTKLVVLIITTFYLLLVSCTMGLKVHHWVIAGLYNTCIWMSPQSRRFILAFSAFVVFAIIYDLMKAVPNYLVNPVDVASLYNFEKCHFGINIHGRLLTLNEYFAVHHNSFLDLLSGLCYINWIPVPLAFGLWLYIKNKQQFLCFSLSFLLVNLIGFCIYYIHPAAPPWYVARYGFEVNPATHGEVAGLARFDELLGIKVFSLMYSQNSNVFAAVPSLHCAYPVVVLYYAFKNNTSIMKILLTLFMLGIWFSAFYSGHHYLTDIILGVLCAVLGILVFQGFLIKREWFRKFLIKYLQLII